MVFRDEMVHFLGGPYDGATRRIPVGINQVRLDADAGSRSVWYQRLPLGARFPAVFGFLPEEWTTERAWRFWKTGASIKTAISAI
jgi:hypothetical protein